MTLRKKIYLIITIIYCSIQVNAQYKVNDFNSKGNKQGLWVIRENNITKNVRFYINDTLDGFSFDFNDSGEIVKSIFYEKGDSIPYPTSLYSAENKDSFLIPKSFSGRLRLSKKSPNSSIWVYKNGVQHGIAQNDGKTGKNKTNYIEYINFNGWGIYMIFFDKKKRPELFFDLSKIPTNFIIEGYEIKRNKLYIDLYNPTERRVTFPNFKHRSLSYVKTNLDDRFYKIKADTLIVTVNNATSVDEVVSDGFDDRKICKKIKEQHTYHDKYVEDFLYPYERRVVSVKIAGLSPKKIRAVIISYNGLIYFNGQKW